MLLASLHHMSDTTNMQTVSQVERLELPCHLVRVDDILQLAGCASRTKLEAVTLQWTSPSAKFISTTVGCSPTYRLSATVQTIDAFLFSIAVAHVTHASLDSSHLYYCICAGRKYICCDSKRLA
jgi:hypothetical protein